MDTVEAIARLSPVAATYAPQIRCIMCNAPMHRSEYDRHLMMDVRIADGLAADREKWAPPGGPSIAQLRRRRGLPA